MEKKSMLKKSSIPSGEVLDFVHFCRNIVEVFLLGKGTGYPRKIGCKKVEDFLSDEFSSSFHQINLATP